MEKDFISIGDSIPISEKHINHIKAIEDKVKNYTTMSYMAVQGVRDAQAELWDFIHSIEPQTEGMHMVLKSEEKLILITGKI